MNHWQVLGIEPTDNITIIKKAYAQRLKLHHPEDDPQGYQKLREAYDYTMKQVRQKCQQRQEPMDMPGNEFPSTVHEEETEEPITEIPPSFQEPLVRMRFENSFEKPLSIEEQNNLFMTKVETLYADFFSRVKTENWKALLGDDVIWNLENRQALGNRMLEFFSNHHYLPQEIWGLLNNAFIWIDEGETSCSYEKHRELLAYIQKQLQRAYPMSFIFFNPKVPVDYDKFLECRENALDAFKQDNSDQMKLFIDAGKSIYRWDPDLLLIEVIYHLRENNMNEAIKVASALLQVNPKDGRALLCRSIAHYESAHKEQAYKDICHAYNRTVRKPEIPVLVAKGFFQIGRYENARRWLEKAVKKKSSNMQARSLLDQVYSAIQGDISSLLDRNPNDPKLKKQLQEIEARMNINNSKMNAHKNANPLRKLVTACVLCVVICSCLARLTLMIIELVDIIFK